MTAVRGPARFVAAAEMEIRALRITDWPAAHFLFDIKQVDPQRRRNDEFSG
jgi:hypothetical protein